MTKFRLDPSISWGDVGMALTALVATVTMAVNLQAQVDHQAQQLERVETAMQQTRAEVREVELLDEAKRNELRREIKADLGEINGKLDRLIERQLDGRNGR